MRYVQERIDWVKENLDEYPIGKHFYVCTSSKVLEIVVYGVNFFSGEHYSGKEDKQTSFHIEGATFPERNNTVSCIKTFGERSEGYTFYKTKQEATLQFLRNSGIEVEDFNIIIKEEKKLEVKAECQTCCNYKPI
jgi:hypothetical protein